MGLCDAFLTTQHTATIHKAGDIHLGSVALVSPGRGEKKEEKGAEKQDLVP